MTRIKKPPFSVENKKELRKMINGGTAPIFYNESSININSVFNSIPEEPPFNESSQVFRLDSPVFNQIVLETAAMNSQEIAEITPTLMGSDTGLSQYLNEAEISDKKPQVALDYSMIENWNDVEKHYHDKRVKNSTAMPDQSDLNSPDIDFKLILPPVSRTSKYVYSRDGQLFIKGDSKFHFTVSFKPIDSSVKFIRLMPVIPSNISKAVVRCENHASKDVLSPHEKKYNVIHSDYPQVIYEGSKEGKSTSERLSIVFPLPCSNRGIGENNQSTIETTIPIEFVCQTSCIGRDDVAVICTLENSTEILARSTMPVKICSCPKRDVAKKDEEQGLLSSSTSARMAGGGSRKRPMHYSSSKRIGEGKRIKTENTSNQENCGVPLVINHSFSCPKTALEAYIVTLNMFRGFLYKSPEKQDEYEPIIKDLARKKEELEARLATINNFRNYSNA